MRIKRIAIPAAVVLLVLAAVAWHFLIGYVEQAKLTDRITVLTRQNILNQVGGNMIVFSADEGAIVVDTQLPPLASSTRSAVNALLATPVSTVIVTHWHPDHSGGISAFSNATQVVAHENVLKRLSAPQEGFGLTKPGSHHEFDARSFDGLPNKTVTKRLDLVIGSSAVSVVYYANAHTDGDLAVFFSDQQIVAVGDLVWPGSFPYIDVHNGGSVAGLELALRAILAASKPDYRFVPGHGESLSIEMFEEYLDMVSASRRWIEARLENGQNVDQVKQSGLPEEWQQWASSLVPSASWVEMVSASRAAVGRAE